MRRFIPFLLLLFIIAAFLRVEFFFTVVYLFSAVYLLSQAWTRRSLGQLRMERRFTGRAFTGDRATVKLTIRNTGWLPLPWLKLHESVPVNLSAPPFLREVMALGPHERRAFTYALDCRRRGYYLLGPLRARVGYLLGVAAVQHRQVEAEPFMVYPRVVPLEDLGLPTRSPLVALPARTPLFEDPSRVMGVRGYERGDSPRRIHWTATASTGELVVKQYEPSIAREVVIFLDLGREHYEQRRRYTATELAIVVAASIAHHVVVNEGLSVGLAAEGWDPLSEEVARFFLPPRSERVHLMKVLEILARIEVVEGVSFPDMLRRDSVKLPWGTTLTVVAGRESEQLFDTLVYLRRAGFALALILVQPVYPSEELRRRADRLGMPIHRVWTERDLEAWA